MTVPSADQEARINELESRLTLSDQAAFELSSEVYRQQQQLTALDALINQLMDQLKQIEAGQTATKPDQEIPPHY